MPLLAALVGGLFASLAEYFAKWLTKKVAFGLAALTVFAALTAGLFAAGSAIVSGLSLTVPNAPGLMLGFYMINVPALLGALSAAVAVDTAVSLYRWNVSNLKLVQNV